MTELADGVFIGCSLNHAVTDGTSFWNFFNTFAELSRGVKRISRIPDFNRDSILISPAVLKLPAGGPTVTFSGDAPIRERIFRFSRESILKLKAKVNNNTTKREVNGGIDFAELMGKHSNDTRKYPDGKLTPLAWLMNAVSRETIQSIPTYATAGDVLGKDLRWCAEQLNKNVLAHGNATVRKYVEDWEKDPRCFPLGNFDGAMITMGSSPRFPMYDNDFGWGRPVAVQSGRANKFDGKISAFPGRDGSGSGSVDLEVVLAPETMAGLLSDPEFMQYVSSY
ncbi:UNVERIFIED_CONTAM: BAHD acyltransferase DCR [Sesamum calycinum]|uniref:BAHD acyltransferase DCR n=1 Tax=Sesamum calycinum TaxID=2727403 RepID=A0AAW2RPQ2_9LAMI